MNVVTKKLSASAGFTILEMLLVVGVLAILAGLSFPTLIGFLKMRDVSAERMAQLEINKALQGYIAQRGMLPEDSSDWARELSAFSNLSPNQIRNDTWGNARSYIMFTRNEVMFGQNIPVFFVSVLSRGPDLTAGGVTDRIAIDGTNFAISTNNGWWKNQATPVAAFGELAPSGDDIMLRFNDRFEKIEKYNLTLKRLQDIGVALENFSRSRFADALASGMPEAEQRIHYPLAALDSSVTDRGTVAATPWSEYNPTVMAEMKAITGFETHGGINIFADHASRRTNMISLMRAIGLPDSHCCSAMATFNNSGVMEEVPFYYASNPRPRTSTGCGPRADPFNGQTPLPARVSTLPFSDPRACY